jgi:Tol biopolymer transport system component
VRVVVLAALVLGFAAAPAAARGPVPAKPQTASLDSDAPKGAPPHWLPNERWVMQHWIPYGQMRVYVTDRRSGRTELASLGIEFKRDHHSAHNASLSADGRMVAYETSESSRGELDVWVTDLRTKRARRIPAPAGVSSDLYEPALSPDGRFLVFTALAREASGTRQSDVYLRDLRTGRTVRVSDGAGGESWEPVVSAGGLRVAFTHGTRVVVKDLATGAATTVAPPAVSATASEPSLSRDGLRVAFTARGAGEQETGVYVHDPATGATMLASRASGASGPPAQGASSHPSLSADGRSVAFTSDAWNLPGKCNPARGIFVRDLERATTTLVSRGDGANRGVGPTKGSGAELAEPPRA